MYSRLTSTLIFTLFLFTFNLTTGYADDSQNNNSGYELIDAVKNNDLDKIQQLEMMPNYDSNSQDENGLTALMHAVKQGESLRQLSNFPNIDANIQDNKGYTALMYAIQKGRIYIVIELYQLFDIDANIQDKNGYNALMHAVFKKQINLTKALIK